MSKLYIVGESNHTAKPDWVTVKFRLASTYKDHAVATKDILSKLKALQVDLAKYDLEVKHFRFFMGIDYHFKLTNPAESDLKELLATEKSRSDDVIVSDYDSTLVRLWSSHDYFIEFPMDNELLAKIVTLFSDYYEDLIFNISFSIKDEQSIKDMMLEKAVNDAVHKATLVAKTLGENILGLDTLDTSPNFRMGITAESMTKDFVNEFQESSWDFKKVESKGCTKFTKTFVPSDTQYSGRVRATFRLSGEVGLPIGDEAMDKPDTFQEYR